MGLWIHAADLRRASACDALASQLEPHARHGSALLVEFPSGVHADAAELQACSARLVQMRIATAYRVADADALACASALAGTGNADENPRCAGLRTELAAARRSRLFTDIAFDHDAAGAMEALTAAKPFRWNAWNVEPAAFSGAASARFSMAVLGVAELPGDSGR